ncbi:MAG: flagellar motor switch protein FliN [Rubripirellula sp.]
MADPADENQEDEPKADVAQQTADVDASTEASDGLNTDDIEALLDHATDSLEQATGNTVSTEAKPAAFSLNDLSPDSDSNLRQPIDLLGEVEMDLRIELGRTEMRLEEVLDLRGGSVVALDKLAGDPVDVFVNGKLVARGEVLVMNDNFCIRVTELVGA